MNKKKFIPYQVFLMQGQFFVMKMDTSQFIKVIDTASKIQIMNGIVKKSNIC